LEKHGKEKTSSILLGLSENKINLLKNSDFYKDADLCWKWFESKQVSGDEIIYTFGRRDRI
jgi:hypothetical protein